MKRLLVLLFLVIGLSFVVQAVPAPDRDIGNVSYAMPTIQVNNVFDFAMVSQPVGPVMLCEYSMVRMVSQPVGPVMLCEYSMVRITPTQEDAKQMEQCTMEVISPPPYSQSFLCIINNPIFKTNQCLLSVIPPYKGPNRVALVNDNQQYIRTNFS